MKQITYVRDGVVVVFENPDGIPLVYGAETFSNTRWVLTTEVFKTVQRQNYEVEFVDLSK